jgi:hypothetical protein
VRKLLPGQQNQTNLNSGAPKGWCVQRPESAPWDQLCAPKGSSLPLLSAVVSTWKDWDIIGACVRNCFAQGCSEVLILDNDSQDDTVERAVTAGATVGKVYSTRMYDDDLRVSLQNALVKERVESGINTEQWWLTLDADEFPCGQGGSRLVDTLSSLPDRVTTVGYDCLDLYPMTPDEYVVGQHPASCMPFGVRRSGGRLCYGLSCSHWKHPVLRYRGKFDVAQMRGNHVPAYPSARPTYEPSTTLWMFHAPFRRRVDTEARLRALCNGRNKWDDDVTRGNGAVKRFKSLEAVYNGWWDRVELPHTQMYGRDVVGLTVYPWRTLVPSLDHLFSNEESSGRISLPCV